MMKEKFEPQIVFVRHAHRDKPIPDADNGLSEKGLKQVAELVRDYENKKLPKSHLFWSSPKKRCIETLKPLSQIDDNDFDIKELLNEQQSSEGRSKFQNRIMTLIEKVEKLNETIYLCSHGDLIPEAIELICGKTVDISKGQALILQKEKGKWILL